MKRKAKTSKDSRGTKKDAERLQFIEWLALPSWKRKPKAQAQFARVIRVDPATLSIWKSDPLLMAEVQKRATEHTTNRRPDVLGAIVRSAVGGNAYSQKLFLQHTEGWAEKQKREHEIHEERATGMDELTDDQLDELIAQCAQDIADRRKAARRPAAVSPKPN